MGDTQSGRRSAPRVHRHGRTTQPLRWSPGTATRGLHPSTFGSQVGRARFPFPPPGFRCWTLSGRTSPAARPFSIRGKPAGVIATHFAVSPDDPQASVTRRQKTPDSDERERIATSWRKRYESHSIEAHQARHGAHPEVTVRRLDKVTYSSRCAVVDGPPRVDQLGDGTSGRGVGCGNQDECGCKAGRHQQRARRSESTAEKAENQIGVVMIT